MQVREPIGGQLQIISREGVETIHGASMDVLSRLGIKVWEPKALKLFRDAGAEVDEKTMMVRLPESLVMETVGKAPSEFTMYGRDPRYRLRMGANRVHFSVASQSIRIMDLDGRTRAPLLKDVEDIARLGDALPNIHHVSLMTTPMDVPQDVYYLHMLWAVWKNTVKTTDSYTYGEGMAKDMIDMAAILRGGPEELVRTPTLLGYTNPVSPMQLSKELLQGAIVHAKYNQPMLYAPEALAGATAPATLAGVLVQQNAEVLAGIMVSQLVRPGAPVLYGTVSTVLDMKTGLSALGGPEVSLFNVASAQMARYYNLPTRGTGGNTDSKTLDAQAWTESSISILMAALAGMNFINDAGGSVEGSLVFSYEKLVVDDEVCGMVSRILDGVQIDRETLSVDEICTVGPHATFLKTPFTLKWFRREHFIPSLFDRSSLDTWLKAGAKEVGAIAREKAKRILREHAPEPIDADVAFRIERYVKEKTKATARE